MGFILEVTGPCRDCAEAEILVRRTNVWLGTDTVAPIYKVFCKHERVCGRLQQRGNPQLRPDPEEE